MKKPKKFHFNENFCDLIDNIAVHFDVSQSVLVEDLILSVLLPGKFNLQTTLILNDDFSKKQIEKYLLEGS